MQRRIYSGALFMLIIVFAACTSDPLPDITTDTVVPEPESSTEEVLAVDDSSAASLNGTTWEFDEGFGVGEASFPRSLTFYPAEGEFRLELDFDCGRATSAFIGTQGGIRLEELEWTIGRRCWDHNEFFTWELQTEIDSLGRLLLRTSSGRAAQVLRFTHVQSTSIQTEPVPDVSVGQSNAVTIGRSRWEVIQADGAAVTQGLEQILSFSSISTKCRLHHRCYRM